MVMTTDSTAAAKPNFVVQTWLNLVRFLKEVKAELKKTNWPTRNELTKYVVVVMTTIIVVAIFLFLMDKAAQFLAGHAFNIQQTTR
ncbi:MAG: preprotein translocase subunit SecE [bacterium ADurb.Bin429]|nr:MAG: preprotein translocase subunit SecE [bacterium ADurb.Bin429]